MYFKKNAIVIVNAVTNSKLYALAFAGQGYKCIHIKTNLHDNEDLFNNYDEQIIYDENENLQPVIEKLKKYKIKAVIAGSDKGSCIADKIAAYFDVAKNDAKTSAHRRDKFEMINALAAANLPCSRQFKSDKLPDLINWFQHSGLKKIVIKPTNSALTEGVAVCRNKDDIITIYNKFNGKINITGEINKEFVLQEYLDGKEYIVNSVSCNGQHFITDIWAGYVVDEETISTDLYADLVLKNSVEYEVLSIYVKQILNAVGLKNGAAHSEVKYTHNGPKLVEINPRLAGGIDFSAVHEALGYSQISVAVETLLNPDLFAERIKLYHALPQKQVRFVYFYSEVSGKVVSSPDFTSVLNLKSLHSLVFFPKIGDNLLRTKEAVGHTGYASLLAEDQETIENDYEKLRKYEQQIYQKICDQKP